ncbi:MAG TPA: hypothetical protein VGQ20_12775 [Acidimicrobiales bacterium]|nr:hypothetical protein [Acidimicrobiales bacterium]
MSTFALGPVLIVTVITVAVAVVIVRAGGSPQPATRPVRTGRGRNRPIDPRRLLMMVAAQEAERRTPSRRAREWWAAAWNRREPEPAVIGREAQIKWWQRLRSAVLLLALLVVLGVALAALVGVLVFLAGFFLELATN